MMRSHIVLASLVLSSALSQTGYSVADEFVLRSGIHDTAPAPAVRQPPQPVAVKTAAQSSLRIERTPNSSVPAQLKPLRELVMSAPIAQADRQIRAVEPLNLRGTVDSALVSSDLVRAVDAEARAADALVWRQRFAFLPVVTGNVLSSRLFNDPGQLGAGSTVPGLRNENTASISASVPLFNGFQNYFGLQSAKSSARAARFEALATRDDVAFRTVNAYLNYIAADRSSHLIGKNVQMLERLYEAVRERLASGFSSEADLAQVRSDIAALRDQWVSSQAAREKAREEINSLAGRPVKVRASFPKLARLLQRGQEAFVMEAVQHNPRLIATRHSSDAAHYNSKSTAGRYMPQVNLVGQYRRNIGDNFTNTDRDSWNVGLQLSVPLVNLATVAEIQQSRSLAAAASFRATDAQRQTELQIRTLWKDYLANDARVKLTRVRAQAQRSVSTSSEEQYKLGVLSLDSLLIRQRALTTAEVEEQQALIQYYATMCQILIGAGTFDTAMLDM